MKTALIYGISGQDGAFLSQLLLEKGYRVMGVSRNAYNSSFYNLKKLKIHDKVEIISSSIHDFRSVIKVISEYKPDEIYNLAGQSSVALSFDMPFNPRSPYGVAKAAAFWQVANYREAYDIFACTGILFNHESFLRPENFVTRKIVKSACDISKGLSEKLSLGNITIERD